jgi:predicted secreted protein
MTQPQTLAGYEYKLEYGGLGSSTPVWTKICAIESTELTRQRGVIERAIRDCDEDYAAPTMKRKPGMKMTDISGSGLYATEHVNMLEEAYNADESCWWRITAKDGAVWTGKFVMPTNTTSWNADGQAYAEISISLQSDGSVTFTPVV